MPTPNLSLDPFFPNATRIDNMTLGADEIITWLADVIDSGITSLYNQPEEFWDSISKRMVDAQLSGISGRLKLLRNAIHGEEEEHIINLICEIYLLAKSISKLDHFDLESQLSFLKAGGYNITKKQLATADRIQDEWLTLGVIKGEEDKIKYRRTWIQGVKSKFMGLVLDYAWGKQDFMQNWQAGRTFVGDVRVYPGAYKLRVQVESHNHTAQLFNAFASYPDLEAFLKAYTVALATDPVLPRFPVCLKDISVQMRGQDAYLVDNQLNSMPCKCSENAKWSLLAASAGRKIQVFAEWDGLIFQPVSVVSQGRFIKL